jgi:hypothetical protein
MGRVLPGRHGVCEYRHNNNPGALVSADQLAQRRALRLTALYLGGAQALSEFLGVRQNDLAPWLSAEQPLPPPLLTRVADFLLEVLGCEVDSGRVVKDDAGSMAMP